jgi:nicotinamide phosphoribosyltransferase
MKFAMKCSAIRVNGEWRDVFKDPVTDSGKTSKKGRLKLVRTVMGGKYHTMREEDFIKTPVVNVLEDVFRDGVLLRDMTFDELRTNARKEF